MLDGIHLTIDDHSQVGEARRATARLTHLLGFSETQAGKVSLVITEVAQNMVVHAKRGEIIVRPLQLGTITGVEILALDQGPGIADLETCMRDGFSTAGTAGIGLGALERLSSHLDIYSAPTLGTAVLAQLWSSPLPPEHRSRVKVGAVWRPYPGETVCGDGWAMEQGAGRIRLLLTDGLGHGPGAGLASEEIARLFRSHENRSLRDLAEICHEGVRHTRGAVMAITDIDFEGRTVHFVGVGNISGTIVPPDGSIGLASFGGTIGYSVSKIHEFVYPWPREALLILHTDGLQSKWNLSRYPGLLTHHPALIAGVLYRDFCRRNDDVMVLIVREGDHGPANSYV